ncbi:phosphatidylserine decarboxylase [Gammaproteobacteria bacterium LSUCC0057]|uniref:Phosphatidylserine decarboxylase proenzyme n=1 Tax=Gammaproteobacteria bacterium LSUCC0057 TaxID=2559237 RepID=A0A4Y8UI18_9GAMM|nr:phosphatidylserine decarboxylase [Gammaproteobacteria bacterium LSUCC0057]
MTLSPAVELFVALQRVLPKIWLSRTIGRVAESRRPWLKNMLIRAAISHFNINFDEAASTELADYENFNAFFTRALREGARPIHAAPEAIVSPADGIISQFGEIDDGELIQAKGVHYSAAQLLGCDASAEHYRGGEFATVYLSPRDYHRVHMPCDGKLVRSRYIPGELFSVNEKTATGLANLFVRNERLVCEFDSERGPFALVLVGAMLVAGIETVWGGDEQPGPGAVRERDHSAENHTFARGDEIGRFKFGSTVIALFPDDRLDWLNIIEPGCAVLMGEQIASEER